MTPRPLRRAAARLGRFLGTTARRLGLGDPATALALAALRRLDPTHPLVRSDPSGRTEDEALGGEPLAAIHRLRDHPAVRADLAARAERVRARAGHPSSSAFADRVEAELRRIAGHGASEGDPTL